LRKTDLKREGGAISFILTKSKNLEISIYQSQGTIGRSMKKGRAEALLQGGEGDALLQGPESPSKVEQGKKKKGRGIAGNLET